MNLTKNLGKLRTLVKTLEKCLYLKCKYFSVGVILHVKYI